MSLKKIDQIKKTKWFSIWDIVVFGVIAAVVIVLILSFSIGKDRSALEGFYISYKGEQALIYNFEEGEPVIILKENAEVGAVKDGGFTIRFYTDGRKGYNDIYVDTVNRTVSVTASNCSAHKDCVYTPKLQYNSSTPIICTPHALSVCPLKFTDNGVII